MPDNDAQLAEKIRNSDQEAFRLLFERYQPALFRMMFAVLRDRDEAHEVVQETFVRVWNHRKSLKSDLPVIGYLLRIARNLVRDAAKRSAVRKKYETDVPVPTAAAGDDPEGVVRMRLLEETLSRIVRTSLPDKCREVFLLSRLEGWSNGEIADRLGISTKTVENQITKALRIVRKELSEQTRDK